MGLQESKHLKCPILSTFFEIIKYNRCWMEDCCCLKMWIGDVIKFWSDELQHKMWWSSDEQTNRHLADKTWNCPLWVNLHISQIDFYAMRIIDTPTIQLLSLVKRKCLVRWHPSIMYLFLSAWTIIRKPSPNNEKCHSWWCTTVHTK